MSKLVGPGAADVAAELIGFELRDGEDELDAIRRERAEARVLLLQMLRAPWSRMSPWAITNACVYLEHPSKDAEEDRGCPCGRRKDPR